MNARRKVARGFTLLEILLVIAIIGMLAGAAVVALIPAREGAKIDTTRDVLIPQVMDALERYNLNMGHYPTDEEGGLDALLKEPSTTDDEGSEKKWRGPYVKKSPRDAWGEPLKYELVTDEQTNREVPHVSSNGPDKQEGTDDDIKSWSEDEGSGT